MADCEERLAVDSPDESSDTVDVSSSEYSASSDSESEEEIWPVKRPLATAVKGENVQNEMPRLRRPHIRF